MRLEKGAKKGIRRREVDVGKRGERSIGGHAKGWHEAVGETWKTRWVAGVPGREERRIICNKNKIYLVGDGAPRRRGAVR